MAVTDAVSHTPYYRAVITAVGLRCGACAGGNERRTGTGAGNAANVNSACTDADYLTVTFTTTLGRYLPRPDPHGVWMALPAPPRHPTVSGSSLFTTPCSCLTYCKPTTTPTPGAPLGPVVPPPSFVRYWLLVYPHYPRPHPTPHTLPVTHPAHTQLPHYPYHTHLSLPVWFFVLHLFGSACVPFAQRVTLPSHAPAAHTPHPHPPPRLPAGSAVT